MVFNEPASIETDALRRFCLSLLPGEFVTYDEMKARLGFDVRDQAGRLYRVRDSLKRSGKCVVDIVPKQGVRRLTDQEVVNGHSSRYLRRVGRAALRGVGGNASVEYAALSDADKTRHNVTQATFGVVRLFAKKRGQAKIEAGLKETRPTLPPKDILKLFVKK